MLGSFIGAIILMIVVFFFYAAKDSKNSSNITEAEKAFVFENDSICPVLKLKQRVPIVNTVLKVEANHEVGLSYTPDKVVYTGANVGGVSVGGFHVEKGGYNASLGSKTGKYRITYKYAKKLDTQYLSSRIAYLELQDDLFGIAKENARLSRRIVSEEKKAHLWNTFYNLKGKNNLLDLDDLTKSDAEYIVSWMAGMA